MPVKLACSQPHDAPFSQEDGVTDHLLHLGAPEARAVSELTSTDNLQVETENGCEVVSSEEFLSDSQFESFGSPLERFHQITRLSGYHYASLSLFGTAIQSSITRLFRK